MICIVALLAACQSDDKPGVQGGDVLRDGGVWFDAPGWEPFRMDAPSAPPEVRESDGPGQPDASLVGEVADDARIPSSLDGPDSISRADRTINDEAGMDSAQDVPLSTASIFSNCSTYHHANSTGEAAVDGSILRVLFTPDRKNLISFGTDGRAKVWDVTSTGLVTSVSKLEFSGNSWLFGAIRPDGRYVAVGDSDGTVNVYDLPASMEAGRPVSFVALSWPNLAQPVVNARPRGFTQDGNHLMVSYSSDNPDEPNQVVVWDLPARSIVRQLGTHNDADYPMAFLLADYATSMWVATEETVWLDAGHDTVVTLVDLARSGEAGTPGAPIQFTIADADAYSMAFSPDGSTLAIGFGDGEVGLWDIRNKNAIVAIESPLVAGGSTSYWANVMTYSADGEYVVTAFAGDANCSVNVSWVKPPRQNWSKLLDFDGTAVDISRDGLALAVGENNDGVILYCTH